MSDTAQPASAPSDAPTTAPAANLIRAAGLAYFPVAFLARLPFAMNVVGVLTLVVAARDSLTLGGLTSAAVGLGTALIGPLLGAAADRYGQRPVLLAAGIGNSLALLLMAWVAFAPVADPWVLAVAILVGATAPQVSPMSRSRLVAIIDRRIARSRRAKTLSATLAYESSADEIVFVFGPVLVGLLATTLNPAAPMIGAAILTLVFVGAFALHPSGRTSAHIDANAPLIQAPVSELFHPRVLVLVVGVLGIGFFFGSTLTSLTSFMVDVGNKEAAGLLYGVMGVGSAILALAVAVFPARFTPRYRWLVFAIILVGGAVLIASARTVEQMIWALAVTGIGIGPLIVTIYTFAAMRTPVGRSATLMTMVGSGVIVGQSSSSAIVGALADQQGTALAQWSPFVAAILVLLCALVNMVLSRGERR